MSMVVDCPRVRLLVVKGPLDLQGVLAYWVMWRLESLTAYKDCCNNTTTLFEEKSFAFSRDWFL
uniref:Uncharacterized protein n=1 Tax=Romanomermis culicivorax TaxID=13658 RepID=A0A915HZZ8_ROMCU